MLDPIRGSYLFLPWYAPVVLYATFFLAGVIMLYGLWRHLRAYGLGVREFFSLILTDFGSKIRRFSWFALGQQKVLEGGDSGGIMHGALFFGWLMLFAYTSLIFIQSDIAPVFGIGNFIHGSFYLTLEFLGDSLGLAFVVGLAIAVYRRYAQRLEKLETRWDDHVVLGFLIWIGISGFVLEGLRFTSTSQEWGAFSPVGDAISVAIGSSSLSLAQAQLLYQGFWWAHMFSVMALIAITPYTKLIHVFTSASNIAIAKKKPLGKLNTPFDLTTLLQSSSFELPPNVHKPADFGSPRVLALDACTNCGRCQEVCPAYAAGRDLSPRVVVQDLWKSAVANQQDVISAGVIRDNEMWSCTTCNACVNICPVLINQLDYIIDFRRTLVSENRVDGMKKTFLENEGRTNNPFGLPQSDRQTWLQQAGVPTIQENPHPEYIYWVGCQGSYDPRSKKLTQSVIKILQAAKVNFAILGNSEVCTGEPVRRLGEEAKFQELALRNIETIKNAGAKKVIVHCPHCFNTFLNEYPEFGAQFEVVHHSQFIDDLLRRGDLKVRRNGGKKITFHDPCNLGRVNGIFDEPRRVIKSASDFELVEMPRSREKSFCCGGGGGNVWYQVPEKKKISSIRAEEAASTGADTLAVACPFCITMLEDASKGLPKELAVKDIAEIVAESLA